MPELNFTDYQQHAARSAGMGANLFSERLSVAALGLTGEAGEVADHIKKHLGHGHPLDLDDLRKELGDVLWYVAELSSTLGLDLGEVAQGNVDKLLARYPDGFSSERSQNRA